MQKESFFKEKIFPFLVGDEQNMVAIIVILSFFNSNNFSFIYFLL